MEDVAATRRRGWADGGCSRHAKTPPATTGCSCHHADASDPVDPVEEVSPARSYHPSPLEGVAAASDAAKPLEDVAAARERRWSANQSSLTGAGTPVDLGEGGGE
jgi:hypothetical protein